MTYSCKDQSPSDDACLHYKPYTQWTDIGFESNSNGGGLRDESKNAKGVYECASWFTNSDDLANKYARGANAKQERMAIAGLVREGWATASYNIIGGLTSFSCDVSSSYKPRPNKQNVCWTFTCAYAAYLKQVLKVSPKSVTPSAIGIREADSVQVPVAWTCDPRQYASGDGCQCSCGAFDPDCDSMSSVATDCPNRDDVCIPGAENSAICKLRHQVSSAFIFARCFVPQVRVLLLIYGWQFLIHAFRFSARAKPFKWNWEHPSIPRTFISPTTSRASVAGATTALCSSAVRHKCLNHGPSTKRFMDRTTVATAIVELGIPIATRRRPRRNRKCSIAEWTTRMFVAPCPRRLRLYPFVCTIALRPLPLQTRDSRHQKLLYPIPPPLSLLHPLSRRSYLWSSPPQLHSSSGVEGLSLGRHL